MKYQRPAGSWLLVGGMIAVGLSLRGPIVAVAPVLDDLRREMRITETAAGLLTSIPVVCFAVVSPLVALLARRIGTDATVALGVGAVALGIAVRPWAGFGLMLAGTVLIGVAITTGNVLLPVVAQRDFPTRAGPAMSVVTTSLLVSASVPAVATVPLASVVGWRAALALWAVLAALALGIWYLATRPAAGTAGRAPPAGPVAPSGSVWRAAAVWQLGLFFGLQSLLFYSTTAWLPTMLQAADGLDAAAAGTALSVFQFLGIAGALAVPMLLRGRRLRYGVAATLAVMWMVFFAGLLLVPGGWLLWCTVGGVGQGAGLALGLGLIAVRSRSEIARSVSAAVQTIGYCLGATGPVVVGAITAATAGWTAPFVVLCVLAGVMGILGVRSAAPDPIRPRERTSRPPTSG